MIMLILDILHYVFVACTLYTGYKLYKNCQGGIKVTVQKSLLYAFISSLASIWIINIITGFIIS